MEKIETVPLKQAQELLQDSNVVFVDIRDIRELEREGMIPGALHAPRGMLEFWVDPESPYYKPIFGEGKRFILYCASAIYVHKSIATSSITEVISRSDKRGFMCFSAFCRKARPLANYFKLYSVKYWLWSVNTAIG
mgnify:CR=1 FL=1